MEDFPLAAWLLPQHVVTDAYNRLLERTRWRGLGIRIYGRERIPEWIPGSTRPLQRSHSQASQMSPAVVAHLGGLPRDAALGSHHAQAMPPPLQHRMSQPAMPHHLSHSMHPAPPTQVLRSQPNAQPVPTYPNGIPIHQSMARPGINGGVLSHPANMPMAYPNGSYPQSMGRPESAMQPTKRYCLFISLPIKLLLTFR